VPEVWKQNYKAGDTLECEAMHHLSYVCYVDRARPGLAIEPRAVLAPSSITLVPVLISAAQCFGCVQE
jgi:hypothetical protein